MPNLITEENLATYWQKQNHNYKIYSHTRSTTNELYKYKIYNNTIFTTKRTKIKSQHQHHIYNKINTQKNHNQLTYEGQTRLTRR